MFIRTDRFAFIACVLSAAGCQNQPTDEDYDDIAQAISPVLADDTDSMSDATQLASAELPPGLTNAGNGRVSGVRGGVEYVYTVVCRDGAGAVQTACNDSTDSADVDVSWNGAIDRARYDATVTRDGSWTLTGIQSGTATFAGAGSFNLTTEFTALNRDATRNFLLDYQAQYDDVFIDIAAKKAIGGSASFVVHAERMGSNSRRRVDAEFDVNAQVTFQSDGTASVVLDGQRSYVVTLADGTVVTDE